MRLLRAALRTLWSLEAIPLITLYTAALLVLPVYKTALPVTGRK